MVTNARRTSERTCAYKSTDVCAYVRAFARSLAARARTHENKVDNSKSMLEKVEEGRSCKNKITSSRSYFRTCARAWRVTVQRTLTLSLACTLTHTYIRSHVHSHACRSHTRSYPRSCHSSLHVRQITKIFLRDLKKLTYTFEDVGDVEDAVI